MASCIYSDDLEGFRYCKKKTWRPGKSLAALLCFGLSATLGCVSILTPIEMEAGNSVGPDEGLVLGRIYLMDRETTPHTSLVEPFHERSHIQWQIRDQRSDKEYLIVDLPSNGPFLLKLPTGSYYLTALGLDTDWGIWQSSLTASFDVVARKCTYLGT